jgi:hypothetical protein
MGVGYMVIRTQSSSASPPGEIRAYILEMTAELAQMADKAGEDKLAASLREAACLSAPLKSYSPVHGIGRQQPPAS